jgi:hypothetical protein
MQLSDLRELFEQARKLVNHSEFVVVGSLSILGTVRGSEAPARMLMSIDVDCFTRNDPPRIFELTDALGEGSAFEATHGFYLDPISPKVPTLPEQWEARLVRVPLDERIVAYFLDPNDAAISKYARGDPRDREWIRAGLAAGLLSASIIETRFSQTDFLDSAERERARKAIAEDRAGIGDR